jgi:hypothetical protein
VQQKKENVRSELGLDVALQLQKISTALIPEGNINALQEGILDAAISLMPADMGSMQVFLPQRDELRLLASAAFWECVHGGMYTTGTAASSALNLCLWPRRYNGRT